MMQTRESALLNNSLVSCSYEVVYFDLDGTLLNDQSEVPRNTTLAVRELKNRGVAIGIATGRMYSAASHFVDEIQCNAPLILYNGAQLASPEEGSLLWEAHLIREVSLAALKVARLHGSHVNFYRDGEFYVESLGPHGKRFVEKEHIIPVRVKDLEGLSKTRPPIKMLLIGEPTELVKCRNKLKKTFQDEVSLMFSEPDYLEVLPSGVSKGTALKRALQHMNIPAQKAMALGDGENDAALLREAGWGVAMENARPEAKMAADHVTGPNTDTGVVDALKMAFPHILGEGNTLP